MEKFNMYNEKMDHSIIRLMLVFLIICSAHQRLWYRVVNYQLPVTKFLCLLLYVWSTFRKCQ